MTMSSPPDTVAPEQLSDIERAYLENEGAHDIEVERIAFKLLRIHDRLQARVGVGCLECNELKRERNETQRLLEKANARIEYLVLEKPDQVAGLEARVAELERECSNLVIIIKQSRAEGFGVIRGKDLEPPGGVRSPVVETTGDFGDALKKAVKDRFGD